jgi:DNA-directed RNA polymerase specialized sigma24 family protein
MQTDSDPFDNVEGRKAILTIFEKAKPLTKLIVIGIAEGRTHADIGEALNMTADGIKKRLATFRRKVKVEVDKCT